MKRSRIAGMGILAAAGTLVAASLPDPTPAPSVEVRSLGAMATGPNHTLFIGDSEAGQILALQLNEKQQPAGPVEIAGIDGKVAQLLGTTPDQITINDLAVMPETRNVYLSVTRGRGADAKPVLLRLTRDASRPLEEVPLTGATAAPIPDAPQSNPSARRNPRTFTVTDLAFTDGQLYIAGLSNQEFSSAFRRMAYPFNNQLSTTTLEIYHVSHGQNETNSPVMTFVPARINGKTYVVAGYTCTPLVAFEVDAMKNGQHVVGRTVAELGAGNQPVDIITYSRNGQENFLIANSRHPMMRVAAADVASGAALTDPTKEEGIARVPLTESGIRQLADLDAQHVLVISAGRNGGLDLRSIAKSSL